MANGTEFTIREINNWIEENDKRADGWWRDLYLTEEQTIKYFASKSAKYNEKDLEITPWFKVRRVQDSNGEYCRGLYIKSPRINPISPSEKMKNMLPIEKGFDILEEIIMGLYVPRTKKECCEWFSQFPCFKYNIKSVFRGELEQVYLGLKPVLKEIGENKWTVIDIQGLSSASIYYPNQIEEIMAKNHLLKYVLVNGRVKALKDIPEIGVKKGDIGGKLYSMISLPHDDNSWIHEGAYIGNNYKLENSVIGQPNIKNKITIGKTTSWNEGDQEYDFIGEKLGKYAIKNSKVTGKKSLKWFNGAAIDDTEIQRTDIYDSNIDQIYNLNDISYRKIENSTIKGGLNADIGYHIKNSAIEGNVEIRKRSHFDYSTIIINSSMKGDNYLKEVCILDSEVENSYVSAFMITGSKIKNSTISAITIEEKDRQIENLNIENFQSEHMTYFKSANNYNLRVLPPDGEISSTINNVKAYRGWDKGYGEESRKNNICRISDDKKGSAFGISVTPQNLGIKSKDSKEIKNFWNEMVIKYGIWGGKALIKNLV